MFMISRFLGVSRSFLFPCERSIVAVQFPPNPAKPRTIALWAITAPWKSNSASLSPARMMAATNRTYARILPVSTTFALLQLCVMPSASKVTCGISRLPETAAPVAVHAAALMDRTPRDLSVAAMPVIHALPTWMALILAPVTHALRSQTSARATTPSVVAFGMVKCARTHLLIALPAALATAVL